MKEGVIYMYTSPSNKVYVGQTTNPEQRKKQHRRNSNRHYSDKGGCKCFYKATRKYGFDNFKYVILHTALDETKEGLKEKLDFWERFYISEYKSNDNIYGYNLTAGGDGCIANDEVKRKMSESHKGISHTEESKRKISEAQKGKQLSDEHKRKVSESLKGHTSPMKGMHHSYETKIKISESLTGISYPKLKWITEAGEIREMRKNMVVRFHPNWIQINENII